MTSTLTPSAPSLLDQVRDIIRLKHYSIRTEQAYLQWIRRFILFHGKRHPRDLGGDHVTAFLSDLAVRRRVSASTQNQMQAPIYDPACSPSMKSLIAG